MNQTTLHQGALSACSPTTLTDHIAEELRRYDEHLRDVRGLAAATRRGLVFVVGRLLQQHYAGQPVAFSKLRPDDIRCFTAKQLEVHPSVSHASMLASALRSYLRYRATCADPVGPLAAVVASPDWKLASLPRALKEDDVERLLNSFTSELRWPKRGYAMVRCGLYLGLRSCEIAQLMLDDIDWRAGTVTLRGTKSLRQDILPLPMATGQALADYLQHERPAIHSPAVFVRHLAPYDQPITAGAIRNVIRRAYHRIGLTHSRSHALRHTWRAALLNTAARSRRWPMSYATDR